MLKINTVYKLKILDEFAPAFWNDQKNKPRHFYFTKINEFYVFINLSSFKNKNITNVLSSIRKYNFPIKHLNEIIFIKLNDLYPFTTDFSSDQQLKNNDFLVKRVIKVCNCESGCNIKCINKRVFKDSHVEEPIKDLNEFLESFYQNRDRILALQDGFISLNINQLELCEKWMTKEEKQFQKQTLNYLNNSLNTNSEGIKINEKDVVELFHKFKNLK